MIEEEKKEKEILGQKKEGKGKILPKKSKNLEQKL